jgi:ABC-type polysaccharide/polyol phosphate transport system ATPase subunit
VAVITNIIELENVVLTYPEIGIASIKDFLSRSIKKRPKLDIENIDYYRPNAIDGVTFQIPSGAKFGILGHNGSGKSTLLALLLGIMQPNEGKVNIKGRPVGLLEMGSGFHPELSGKENILFHLSILGVRLAEAEKLIPAIMEFCELGEALSYPLRTYSSGMVTRLAFSVLCHVPADIFLVDEVITVGDYSFQKKCLKFMEAFSRNGGTIVFVAQDPNSLREFCDTGLCLQEGKVSASGDMDYVAQKYINDMEKGLN